MLDRYADILIHIRERDEKAGVYPVEATLDDGSQYTGDELRVDMQKLLSAQLDAESYGMELFNALFASKIRRGYDNATGRAEALVALKLSAAERVALIRSLVPVAAANPTALDTVLAPALGRTAHRHRHPRPTGGAGPDAGGYTAEQPQRGS